MLFFISKLVSTKHKTIFCFQFDADLIKHCICIQPLTLHFSDQNLISEVQSKLKLSKDRRIYYEYYMTSESNGDLVLINKRSSIQKISENFNSEVANWHKFQFIF